MTRLAQFQISYIHLAQGCCRWHKHQYFEMVYYMSGSGNFLAHNDLVLPFGKGSLCLIPQNALHAQQNHLNSQDCCLLGNIEHLPWLKNIDSPIMISTGLQKETIESIITLGQQRECHSEDEQSMCDLRMTMILMSIKNLLSPCNTSLRVEAEDPIEKAARFMQVRLNTLHSIEEVAAHVGWSPDYFRHRFGEAKGCSPKTFLTQTRLEYAKQLLSQTSLPQKVIAEQCGFETVRYFCSRFQLLCGSTPGEYRKNSRFS